MRTLAPLALAALLAGAAFVSARFARAEDPVPTVEQQTARRLEVLERQVAYLRSREAKHTVYMLKNADRAEGLRRLAADLRAGGFAAAANPSPTRERLLVGLEALAESLKRDLPVETTQELQLLEAAR
jgi:hypothetical protein